jgi:DNA replication protein DnaC
MPMMLGTATTPNQPVNLPAAARFEGLAVVGKTGQGKSVLLSTSACTTVSRDMVSVSLIRTEDD